MIGLFLGSTDFPQIVLKTLKKENKKYFIIDLSKNNRFKNDKNAQKQLDNLTKEIVTKLIWNSPLFRLKLVFWFLPAA